MRRAVALDCGALWTTTERQSTTIRAPAIRRSAAIHTTPHRSNAQHRAFAARHLGASSILAEGIRCWGASFSGKTPTTNRLIRPQTLTYTCWSTRPDRSYSPTSPGCGFRDGSGLVARLPARPSGASCPSRRFTTGTQGHANARSVNRIVLNGALTAAGAIACALTIATVAGAQPSRSPAQALITENRNLDLQIVARLNTIRAARGVARLRLSPGLVAAAAEHSREMATSGRFQHASTDGGSFWTRVRRYYPAAGYRWWAVGENLFWRSPGAGAAGIVAAWLASGPHRRILLNAHWRELGVSAIQDANAPGDFLGLEATIVTADFGARNQ